MARHSQQPERKNLTCTNCQAGACEACPDRLLYKVGRNSVCECRRQEHDEKVGLE